MSDFDSLSEQIAALENSVSGALSVTSAFSSELDKMRDNMAFTGREVNTLSTNIGSGLRRAFDGLVFDGMKLSDALTEVAESIMDSVYSVSMRPVQNAVGGSIAQGIQSLMTGIMGFEKGGSFVQGRVMPFAKGGVVSSPTHFPMRGGNGLMGEAGPEAIMPLSRGADGRLGVAVAGGGRPVSIVMNISTPDAQSFSRGQTQIAAQMQRALGRAQRNR